MENECRFKSEFRVFIEALRATSEAMAASSAVRPWWRVLDKLVDREIAKTLAGIASIGHGLWVRANVDDLKSRERAGE